MTLAEQRSAAIEATLEKVRRIEAEHGITRDSLARIREHMVALAARRELFPRDEFRLPEGKGEDFTRLSVDPDGRYELYLEVADKSLDTLPHDHTTWAVVVGVEGMELNRLYEGDGGTAGEAPLKLREEIEVKPGTGVCMMPTDFHSIHMQQGVHNMHLHLYGIGFAYMKDRRMYDPASARYMAYDPNAIVS